MPTKAANVNDGLSADFYSGIEGSSIPDCDVVYFVMFLKQNKQNNCELHMIMHVL